jgi:hypothetical protein
MEGLNIVELGNVCEETRGVMVFGISDPGGIHYFWNPGFAVHVRKICDVKPAGDNGSARSRTGT